jgi:hypothetical protein
MVLVPITPELNASSLSQVFMPSPFSKQISYDHSTLHDHQTVKKYDESKDSSMLET